MGGESHAVYGLTMIAPADRDEFHVRLVQECDNNNNLEFDVTITGEPGIDFYEDTWNVHTELNLGADTGSWIVVAHDNIVVAHDNIENPHNHAGPVVLE